MSARLVILSLLCAPVLAACATGGPMNWPGNEQSSGVPPILDTLSQKPDATAPLKTKAPVRLALLLPLSGQNKALGESLLQSAQLAVTELNEPGIELTPVDTGGTPDGAARAMKTAQSNGASLVVGPVFGTEVAAVKPLAAASGTMVLGFSTDWKQFGGNVFSLGILPFDQAQRMGTYAAQRGMKHVLLVSVGDAYGEAVREEFTRYAQRKNVKVTNIALLPDASNAAKAIAQAAKGANDFDGAFLPLSGNALKTTITAMKAAGLTSKTVQYMGTGLWDEPGNLGIPDLNGAVFAAPSPAMRKRFEQSYRNNFGATPPRLASLAYDAVALSVVIARTSENTADTGPDFSAARLTNPNGFAGVDGLFRLKRDGTNERGIAIHKIVSGRDVIVEDAPTNFLFQVNL